jgi:hypothetical protein
MHNSDQSGFTSGFIDSSEPPKPQLKITKPNTICTGGGEVHIGVTPDNDNLGFVRLVTNSSQHSYEITGYQMS